MASQSKAHILASHAANAALNIPLPAVSMRGARDLGADEPFQPLDERIIAGAVGALESGQTHYVDVPGIAPLRAAIAEHLNATCGTSWDGANIIVTAGMQEARFLSTQIIGAQYRQHWRAGGGASGLAKGAGRTAATGRIPARPGGAWFSALAGRDCRGAEKWLPAALPGIAFAAQRRGLFTEPSGARCRPAGAARCRRHLGWRG